MTNLRNNSDKNFGSNNEDGLEGNQSQIHKNMNQEGNWSQDQNATQGG